MEGTGTNLRPAVESAVQLGVDGPLQHPELPPAGQHARPGSPGRITSDPFKNATIRLWDPFVRPAEVQQWNFTTEFQLPFQNVLTAGLRRTARHAPDGRHAVFPEAARERPDSAQSVPCRQSRPDQPDQPDLRHLLLREPGVEQCRRRQKKKKIVDLHVMGPLDGDCCQDWNGPSMVVRSLLLFGTTFVCVWCYVMRCVEVARLTFGVGYCCTSERWVVTVVSPLLKFNAACGHRIQMLASSRKPARRSWLTVAAANRFVRYDRRRRSARRGLPVKSDCLCGERVYADE